MNVHAFKSFGRHDGAGNPALVIADGPDSIAARQEFARERILPCAFVDPGAQPGAPLQVDYYYPHMRMPLCVHSTLAVAALLFAQDGAPASIALETAMRRQRLVVSRQGADYFVRLEVQPAPAVEAGIEQVAQLLRVAPAALAAAPRVGSVGSPKLLVQVRDIDVLYDLAPDLHAVVGWSHGLGLNGIFAWCVREAGDGAAATCEGRNFNHLATSLEDSATGVAAGALCAHLGHDLVLYQGRAVWRDCVLRARVEDGAILVGGMVESTA